jgi:hypothetical protein
LTAKTFFSGPFLRVGALPVTVTSVRTLWKGDDALSGGSFAGCCAVGFADCCARRWEAGSRQKTKSQLWEMVGIFAYFAYLRQNIAAGLRRKKSSTRLVKS